MLSCGRFIFGVGFGWNKPELLHHGVRWADRRDVAREHILAMKTLWTQEEASFDGIHVKFEASWSWPKPVQRPHPSIFLGARAGPKTFANIVEYADGWMPNDVDDLLRISELRTVAADSGRDPATVDITFYGAGATFAQRFDEIETAGVERVVFWISSGTKTEVLHQIDTLHESIARSGTLEC